ncbi:DUF4232 domain-containing protein [Streptomyces sp. NPDC091682]
MHAFHRTPFVRTSRTFRPQAFRRLAGAAAAALVVLSLTGCEDGTGLKDGGASAASSPATDAAPSAAPPAAAAPKASPTAPAPSAPTAAGEQQHVLCNGANTGVTVQPVSRPLNHMLITVKNTGSKTCDLTYYPVLRFDEMQWVPAAQQQTRPQAVVSLAPGESG